MVCLISISSHPHTQQPCEVLKTSSVQVNDVRHSYMRFKVLSNQKEKAQLADMASHVWLERKERKEGERRRRKKKKKKKKASI